MIRLALLFLVVSQNALALYQPPLLGWSEQKDSNDIRHITAVGLTKPLAIFSHATVYKGLIQVSCIQGFKPGTFEFLGPDAGAQAEQVLQNLKTILEQAHSSLDRVLKLTIFFADIDKDFEAVNEVINRYFPQDPPARSSIGVTKLPRNARVVMECSAAQKY